MFLRQLLNGSKNIRSSSIPKSETVTRIGTAAVSSLSSLSSRKASGKQNECQRVINRNLQTTALKYNYDADGKTVVTDLEDDIGKFVIIKSMNEFGFGLSNNGYCVGSLLLFPNVYLSWKVKTIDDITEESLTVFKVIEPKLDTIILGIGAPNEYSSKQVQDLRTRMKNTGLNIEIQSTRTAIATYNFMLADLRVMAGAFLVPASELKQRFSKLNYSKNGETKKIEVTEKIEGK